MNVAAAEVYHEPTLFICFVHPASREPAYEIDQQSMRYSRTRNMMSGHFGRLVQVSRLGGSMLGWRELFLAQDLWLEGRVLSSVACWNVTELV